MPILEHPTMASCLTITRTLLFFETQRSFLQYLDDMEHNATLHFRHAFEMIFAEQRISL